MILTARNLLITFLLVIAVPRVLAVEHPGVVPKGANCSSCHADKLRGRSVHSVMPMACTTCHLVQTQGDMMITMLVIAKDQICFACHQQASEAQMHKSAVKGPCLDCHDSHSSNRRMLLRGLAAPQTRANATRAQNP